MPKSVRVNLSIPHQTYERYAEWARLTGMGVPALLLQQIVHQSAFVQRAVRTMNYKPRDGLPAAELGLVQAGDALAGVDSDIDEFIDSLDVEQAEKPQVSGSQASRGGKLTRQQRRQLQREERKSRG
jgi:hypothetical protein